MASQEYLNLLIDAINRGEQNLNDLYAIMRKLHESKNAGYAGKDNPDPWANFRECEKIGVTAFLGCMVRWTDKVKRVENLLADPNNEQVGEAVTDTLMDLAAYSLIAVCLLREQSDEEKIAAYEQMKKEAKS